MKSLYELLAQNCANKEYVIGDVMLDLFPIDFIKPSVLRGCNVRICCEDNKQLEDDFIRAFKQIEELISNDKIVTFNEHDKDIIGSFGLMTLKTAPKHIERTINICTTLDVWEILSSHYYNI